MALEANAYLTTDAVADNIIPELYNEELQQWQYEQEALRNLGADVTSRILSRAGNNLNIYKGTEFQVGALTQGTDTPISELDFDTVVLTVNEYGDAKQIPLDTIEDSFEFLVGDLAYGAANAIAVNNDNVIMTELQNTTEDEVYPLNTGTRRTSANIAATDKFDKEQVTEARRRMRINNRFLKYLVIHPNQYKAILDDSDFISKENYPTGILVSASVGTLFGAQVVEHNSVTSVTENTNVTVYIAMAIGEDRAGRQKSFCYGYKRMPVMEWDREFNRKRALTFHYHYRFGAQIVWDEGIIPIKSA